MSVKQQDATTATASEIRTAVRERYGEAARAAADGEGGEDAGCCDPGCGCGAPSGESVITSNLYATGETAAVPEAALRASLGCGNPTALAELHPGEVVLDLGSGGGIDVLLSARRVGPEGKAFGLDMTPEMLELARRNAADAGVDNVEFLEGQIESIPLPDDSVDVIISNCVINLSADKPKVLAEAFRVLRPGGRFAVSDVVFDGELPGELRRRLELWVGCVAGALSVERFDRLLTDVGFVDVEIEPTRVYRAEDSAAALEELGIDPARVDAEIDGRIMAAFVRATKPV